MNMYMYLAEQSAWCKKQAKLCEAFNWIKAPVSTQREGTFSVTNAPLVPGKMRWQVVVRAGEREREVFTIGLH